MLLTSRSWAQITATVSVTNVVTQTAICPLSPFNVDVYGLECKNQPVNATLIGGRRRGTLLTALMRFTCCSSEVLQLFMTEIVWVLNDAIQITKSAITNVFCNVRFHGTFVMKICRSMFSYLYYKIDRKS